MKKLHDELMGKNGLYTKWHGERGHKVLHWAVFVAVAVLLTAPIVSLVSVNYDAQSQVASVQQPVHVQLPQLTNKLIQAIDQYENASDADRAAALNNLVTLATTRKAAMLKEAAINPKNFLLFSLPPGLAKRIPSDLANLIEQQVEVQGDLVVLHRDYPNENRSELSYNLKDDSTGKTYHLHLAKSDATLKTGSFVDVTGYGLEQEVVLAADGSTSGAGLTVLQADVARPTGDQRTLVMLVNFSDNSTSQPWTPAQMAGYVFTNPDSVSAYYRDSSLGLTTFSGDVTNWITLPTVGTSCDGNFESWANLADAAAVKAGFVLSNYSHKLYVINGVSSCPWAGLSTVGGDHSYSWVIEYPGPLNTVLIEHELGHGLGMAHASYLGCGSLTIDAYANCSFNEYGDYYDAMGYATYGFTQNGAHKVEQTWVPTARVQTVTTNGTYTIAPLELPATIPQVLKILKSNSYNPTTGNSYYYVEYRQPVGVDKTLPPGVTGGVGLTIWPSNVIDNVALNTVRLDNTPADGQLNNSSLVDSSLPAGSGNSVFYDAINGIRITQTNHTPTAATVNVEFVPGVCIRSNPTVDVLNFNPIATAGATITYDVVVGNHDTTSCPDSTFTVNTPDLPAGFSAFPASTQVMVAPGSTANLKIGVTSPSSYPNTVIAFTVKATGNADSTRTGSAMTTYYVFTRASSNPIVNITSPVNNSSFVNSKKGSLLISANSSDSEGVSKMELYLDTKLVKTCTKKATSCSTSVSLSTIPAGGHTVTAKAYDPSGNVGSAQVSITKL
jgi:hypothetical protein